MKHGRIKRTSIVFTYSVLLIALSSDVWTNCEYCQLLYAPPVIQMCGGLGSGQSCGSYYTVANSVCCSGSGETNCDSARNLGDCTFYKKSTYGTCSGAWRCAGGTGSSCPGDIIIASSNNCTPTGPLLAESNTCRDCGE